MNKDFEDIQIIAMDEEASYKPDPSMALFNIILKLSSSAPYEWSDYFNDRWKQHIYMMKRDASVSGNRLTIYCVPDELEKDHIPELNKVITETNSKYRAYYNDKKSENERLENESKKDKQALKDLSKNLKLD